VGSVWCWERWRPEESLGAEPAPRRRERMSSGLKAAMARRSADYTRMVLMKALCPSSSVGIPAVRSKGPYVKDLNRERIMDVQTYPPNLGNLLKGSHARQIVLCTVVGLENAKIIRWLLIEEARDSSLVCQTESSTSSPAEGVRAGVAVQQGM